MYTAIIDDHFGGDKIRKKKYYSAYIKIVHVKINRFFSQPKPNTYLNPAWHKCH